MNKHKDINWYILMIKESSVWKWIRDLPEKVGPKLFFQRVESHATGPGIPDVFFCYDGISGYIELKSWSSLSRGQKAWIRRYLLSGGIVFLLYIDRDIGCKILKKCIHSDLRTVDPTNIANVYPLVNPLELPELIRMLGKPGTGALNVPLEKRGY